MKLSEVLKARGLFSNDIKQRFANGQIQLDGDITNDLQLDIDFWGVFITPEQFVLDIKERNEIWFKQIEILGIECMMGNGNVKNKLSEFLSDFHFVRTSKKDCFFIPKKFPRGQILTN